MIDVTDQVINS